LDIAWQVKILILLCLLLISAFFSGSEVALFSLKIKKIENEFASNSIILRYLKSLLEKPRRLLVTILIGNTVANVAASIVAVTLALEYAEYSGISIDIVLTVQILLLTIVVLLFAELIPKVFASKNSLVFAKFSAVPMYLSTALLFPIAETITEAIRLISSKLKIDKSKAAITEDELNELAEFGQEKGTIEEEEQEIISSLVEFKSVLVGEIMTPRVDIVSVENNSDYNELINVINESGHSRIPLYEENLDRILGFIYAKDLLPYINDEKLRKELKLIDIIRKPIFVPKSKKISELMHEFQEKKMHIAIVVDEYGGTAGLVTLEDIIEEVIGEIWDEYDQKEDQITVTDDGTFIVLGKTPVYEVNETLGESIIPEDENYDTIGGLVFNQAGNIPKEGFTFQLNRYSFTVKEVIKKRIKRVFIKKL
jgi:putative hemolysin